MSVDSIRLDWRGTPIMAGSTVLYANKSGSGPTEVTEALVIEVVELVEKPWMTSDDHYKRWPFKLKVKPLASAPYPLQFYSGSPKLRTLSRVDNVTVIG